MKWERRTKVYCGGTYTTVLLTEIDEELQCKYIVKTEDGETQEVADRDLSAIYKNIEEFLRIHSGFEEVNENELQNELQEVP